MIITKKLQLSIYFILYLTLSIESKGFQITNKSTIKIESSDSKEVIIEKAAHVVPTPFQYKALQNEYIAFIHFGLNTFTRKEWGTGLENPNIFNPKNLDTDQWCKVIKDAGMKMIIITAKHHDGFVLWQSRYTKHGIMSSPYKEGKADVIKNLSLSCEKYGLKLGIYLSPADLNQHKSKNGLYSNNSKYSKRIIPRKIKNRPFKNKTTFKFLVDDYNEYFLNQLFELLTEYGSVHEVWFDGAHPLGKSNQKYNYSAWKTLIKSLAPESVSFNKEDIRWCGNEGGKTRKSEWNIIPYKDDPRTMNDLPNLDQFPFFMAKSIGSRDELYQANYLHYHPAETNTSIRNQWFFIDETTQKIRGSDDIFDIYERAVGGNSIFLLNIPPNKEGTLSNRDVVVLKEVKQRIKETYSLNLLGNAKAPLTLFDNSVDTYEILNDKNNSIIISTPNPITINRFLIQEAITTHSERIEKHVLEAWLNNQWKQIATATNVGYKRILRFPKVTSNKFRLQVLESRLNPAIAEVAAYFYNVRPPQLIVKRDFFGELSIKSNISSLHWNSSGLNKNIDIYSNIEIRYTIDGSIPTQNSKLYKTSFHFPRGQVKARAYYNKQKGNITTADFGLVKKGFTIISVDSEQIEYPAEFIFDGKKRTFWYSKEKVDENHFIKIDLGEKYNLIGFDYTPQVIHSIGLIEKGIIRTSHDGKSWSNFENFRFSNLINNPIPQKHFFNNALNSQYIMIQVIKTAGNDKYATMAELDFFAK